jgi:hypothetical protein
MRQQSQYLQQNMQTSPQTIILLQSLRLPNLFIRFDIYNHSRSTIQLYIYIIYVWSPSTKEVCTVPTTFTENKLGS